MFNTTTVLVLIYLTLAIYFTLLGKEILQKELASIKTPYITAYLFGAFFPIFLGIGIITIIYKLFQRKEL